MCFKVHFIAIYKNGILDIGMVKRLEEGKYCLGRRDLADKNDIVLNQG